MSCVIYLNPDDSFTSYQDDGKVYHYFTVEPLLKEMEFLPISLGPQSEVVWKSDEGKSRFKVGQVLSTKTSGDLRIVEAVKTASGVTEWRVCFIATGYTRIVSNSALSLGRVKDPYFPVVGGVGFLGDYDKSDPFHRSLLKIWHHLIGRCYIKHSTSFRDYGGRGVHVDTRWHCYANFQVDVKHLKGWDSKARYPSDYSLDKDTLKAANFYGPETCMWADIETQSLNRRESKYFSAVSPKGELHLFSSLSHAARTIKAGISTVHLAIKGVSHDVNGWVSFQIMEPPEGMVYRCLPSSKDK